ncbi:hypothetical protein [Salinibacter grassmerensis]|uniref:hypothetical protein n=1 Tax=Salinibacter grassmerensis TaxID=3040353 RepID=UPI0021E870DD|nr:hypothetical protein [Salinibacter grassmerensis]
MADSSATQSAGLPDGYVEKTDGRVAPKDLVWGPSDAEFREVEQEDSAFGAKLEEFERVATPAHWVTFDGTTGIVWGVGTSPEESLRTAKFEAFGDDHGAVGYEFACWCEEMSTRVCSEALYEKVNEEGQLSISEDRLQKHITLV